MSCERSRIVAYWNNTKLSLLGRETLVCSAPKSKLANYGFERVFRSPLHPKKQCRSTAPPSKALLERHSSLKISAGALPLPQKQCQSVTPPTISVPERRSSLKSSAGALLLPQRHCRSVAPPTKGVLDWRYSLKRSSGALLLPPKLHYTPGFITSCVLWQLQFFTLLT